MVGQSFSRTASVPTSLLFRVSLIRRGYRRRRSRDRHMWTTAREARKFLRSSRTAARGPAGDNQGENPAAGDNPEGGSPPPAGPRRPHAGPPGPFLSWTTSQRIHRPRRLIHSYEAVIHRPGCSVHRREDEESSTDRHSSELGSGSSPPIPIPWCARQPTTRRATPAAPERTAGCLAHASCARALVVGVPNAGLCDAVHTGTVTDLTGRRIWARYSMDVESDWHGPVAQGKRRKEQPS
jgi:hypothetical protein